MKAAANSPSARARSGRAFTIISEAPERSTGCLRIVLSSESLSPAVDCPTVYKNATLNAKYFIVSTALLEKRRIQLRRTLVFCFKK